MKMKVKRAAALILAAVMLLVLCPAVYAEGESPVEIKAKAAVLMDASTGKVLLSENENDRLYPASVTKIMSLLLIMEAVDSGKIQLSDTVTASAEASSKGGSQIWLKEGEQMTVDELLRATAIASANDACTALGEYIAGSSEAFVKLMNARAKELGMTQTHFENCTGLDDDTETHLTSALDVAIMSRELLLHDRIRQYSTVWMDSLRDGKTELTNTNKLVRFYNGTTGLKTGTTSKAGCCVSASAERDGTHLIAVVMGSETSNDRFNTAKALLNWGFANYVTITPEVDGSLIPDVSVIGGMTDSLTPEISAPVPVLLKKGTEAQVKANVDMAVDVEAPVLRGQVLGTVTFTVDGVEVGECSLTAPADVAALTLSVVYKRILKCIWTQ